MCEVSKGKMISCQLSFYPLGEADYGEYIGQVLLIIEESGLFVSVGAMSTQIKGSPNDVFALLEKIAGHMDDIGCKFAMTTTISNTCGIDIF